VTARQKREPRAITIAEIEQQFDLASYWFGGKWCPAVYRKVHGGYGIRVLWSVTVTGANRQVSYNYFEVDADGTITVAPRGWARAYNPGRVTDIEAAAERMATPDESADRINFGGVR
jgi:NAD(P)H-nitrite reductase large subunit